MWSAAERGSAADQLTDSDSGVSSGQRMATEMVWQRHSRTVKLMQLAVPVQRCCSPNAIPSTGGCDASNRAAVRIVLPGYGDDPSAVPG